jgi:hypothetical protein
MNKDDFISAVAASMNNKPNDLSTDADEPNEKFEEMERAYDEERKEDDTFIIKIPTVTGRVFNVDAREVDWNALGSPEHSAQLEANESVIRGMAHEMLKVDFSDPKSEQMLSDFNESLDNLFENFGIDPGYNEFASKMMVKPYILLFGKIIDALTLITVMEHNTAMHGLATQVFGFSSQLEQVANLNDIADMDNSADGLISAGRAKYDVENAYESTLKSFGPDDHQFSGLITE